MEMRDFLQQCTALVDGGDRVELVVERLCLQSFDRFLVHAACVEIADLLRFGRHPRIDFRAFRFLRDLMKCVVIVLDQLVEASPAAVLRRDLSALDPSAVGIEKEIVRRLH